MKLWPLLAAVLAGCAAGPRPMPLAESGPVEVMAGGQAMIADLQPGPVLTITRQPPFGNAEGKIATDGARAFCAGRGARLSPSAFGPFVAGAWVFRGACA